MDKKRLLGAIPILQGKKVVVVGDLFLDEYLVGRASRLSREAPVPVLEFTRSFNLPGGGANPAVNIQALGGKAYQVGVVGEDEEGECLIASLARRGIESSGIVRYAARPTTTKTRVVAEGSLVFPQQLVRIDRQDRAPLVPQMRDMLVVGLAAIIPQVDAVLISDYRSGVMDDYLATSCLRLAQAENKPIVVDSQGDLAKYRHYSLVKCNRREAEEAVGFPLKDEESLRRAGEKLLGLLEARAVLITLSEEGMYLTQASGQDWHIPASNRSEVFDVTGAGDTAIAVVALALAAGLEPIVAAHLANYAAGLVIRKLGNATATPEELAWAIKHW